MTRHDASTRHVKPIGSVNDSISVGLAVARRLNEAIRSAKELVVFCDGRSVFATDVRSNTAHALPASAIVGTYTRTAMPVEIAEDLDAWRKAA